MSKTRRLVVAVATGVTFLIPGLSLVIALFLGRRRAHKRPTLEVVSARPGPPSAGERPRLAA